MAKKKYKKQKTYSVNYGGSDRSAPLLLKAINLSLTSGKPIPAELAEREASEISKKIPEDIKKEFRDRIRSGDLSAHSDPRLTIYFK